MVNPGAFQGARKEFLISEKPQYSVAVNKGYASDTVALIQQRFFKQFPINLPDTEEPSAEALAAVDDDTPDPKPEEPSREKLTEFKYKMAVAAADIRRSCLEFRKRQIKCWLAYQYMKDNDGRLKETGAFNPYAILMQKTHQQRNHTPLPTGEIKLATRLGKKIQRDQYAAIRDKIARKLFAELPEGLRRSWLDQALEEHQAVMMDYRAKMTRKPSTRPEDRQRGIQGLTQFMQPILDMACDVTGWKLTLLAGGLEPAHGGRLSVISIHSGTTPGDIPMTFGHAERICYKKEIVPIFGSFLQLCYSPEECRSRAIPGENAPLPMSSLETDSDEVTIHAINNLENSLSAYTSSAIPSTQLPNIPINDLPSQTPGINEQPANTAVSVSIPNPRDVMSASPPQSPSNPFPFEDVEDAPHSPIPSPLVSRAPSPTPIDSALQSNELPNSPAPAPVSGIAASDVRTKATSAKKRKHVPDVLADIQPGTKRNRQKSTCVLEAEEHMGAKKKGKAIMSSTKEKKAARGKENRPPTLSKATQTPKAKTSNKRRK